MRRYGPLLRYIIAPILPDEREQEECLSDIYWKIWEKIASFDPLRGSLRAWLTALARNTALNRARTLRADAPLDEAQQLCAESAEQALLHHERHAQLLHALELLGSAERTLFFRKYYYCQSTAQIAAELSLSERAVEGRLRRLRQKLQQQLRR